MNRKERTTVGLLMLVVSQVLLLAVDVSWYFYLASLVAVLVGALLLVL